jgi:hypothetical protein
MRVSKERTISWARQVTRMDDRKFVQILVAKPECKRSLGKWKWKNNTESDPKISCDHMDFGSGYNSVSVSSEEYRETSGSSTQLFLHRNVSISPVLVKQLRRIPSDAVIRNMWNFTSMSYLYL